MTTNSTSDAPESKGMNQAETFEWLRERSNRLDETERQLRECLERARQTVKPIVDAEKKGEDVGDLMNLQLRADQRVQQQSDGEPSLEDLAIQAADYLQKLDDEQAGYISFALRQKMADTRAHAPVVDDGRRQGLQEALRIAKTVNCVEGYMPERAMIELAIEHALALLDKKEG